MRRMTGRQAFLHLLREEGVEVLFGNPGTTELPIMDSLAAHPELRYVLGLQESVVVGMAEGYARAAGRLTVANVHVAPGLGNAMGALYSAKRAGVPLLLVAGQQEQGLAVTEPMLHDDLVRMAAPLVKRAAEVTRAEDLPRVLHRAAKEALTPPAGPVFLSLPGDVLNAEAEIDPGRPSRVDAAAVPTPEALERLADRLLAAEAPLMLAGAELATGGAFAEAARVAELLGAPVWGQSVAHAAVFPNEHPLYMGELTRTQTRMRQVLEPADLLFAAGADVFTLSVPGPEPLPPGLPIVQVSQREAELAKNYPAEIALRADVPHTLAALAPVLERRRTPAQAEAAERRRRAAEARNWTAERARRRSGLAAHATARPIEPEVLMAAVGRTVPDEAIVVDEGLTASRTLLAHLPVRDPGRYHGLCGGGIGWGLPAAVGVQLARPERPVVCVSGDGSALYSIQALWSAAHERLPVTFVICNNASYRILKERLAAFAGEAVTRETFIGMDLQDPAIDFTALAGSMGVAARRVDDPAAVAPALAEAIAAEEPRLLDVHLARGFEG